MKFFDLFKKKNVVKVESKGYDNHLYCSLVHTNDYITLIHNACKLCYNAKYEKDYEGMRTYVEKRCKTGHESILEHSNIIMMLEVGKNYLGELNEVISCCRYLNVKVSEGTDIDSIVYIGGSLRGFKHIVRTIKNPCNRVYKEIFNCLYEIDKVIFPDFIAEGIMDENKFIERERQNCTQSINREKYTIVNIDDVSILGLDFYDLMDLATITVKFTGVSRACSHQLVRHRAGISQMSQRYVNGDKFEFVSPDEDKPELDSNKKYKIKIKGVEIEDTLSNLGNTINNSVYPKLVEQGLLKEDARAFLLNNTSTSLYMTFTLRGFIKFLELRGHKSAQAEIRNLAQSLEKDFIEECTLINESDNIYDYLLPYYEYKNKLDIKDISEEL